MPETIERSGLPFHIHGSFGLRDDRRDFKWLSNDNRRDEAAQWNELILNEVLDTTLVSIIDYAKKSITKSSSEFPSLLDYYYLIPVWENASANWREKHLSAFFRRLGEVDLIMNRRGEWIKMADVLFTNKIDEKLGEFAIQNGQSLEIVQEAVLKCFDSSRLPKISVPRHVIKAFEEINGSDVLQFISITDLCDSLRKNGTDELSNDEKSILLNFLLQSIDKLEQLDGICLLPLYNSKWTQFGKTESEQVFMFSSDKDEKFEDLFKSRLSSLIFDKSKLNKSSINKLADLLKEQSPSNSHRFVEFNSQM